MACGPCWQQRQLLVHAWRQGNPYAVFQAMRQGAYIATDKLRGIDVTRKYGGASLAQDTGRPRLSNRVR